MPTEINTGYVFMVLFVIDKETGGKGFTNMAVETRNPYLTLVSLVDTYTMTEFTLVNWAFILEGEYNKLKAKVNPKFK